ncbi:MAG: fluoride efflux transporter FluC [Dietzia sp.]
MTTSAAWAVIGWAALGGGAGAALRHVVDRWVSARWPRGFPVGILVVNVSGSFALGLLWGWAAARVAGASGGGLVSSQVNTVVTVLGTGALGGYTTFSTASYDTVLLARTGRIGTALAYGLGTMIATVAVAAAGLWAGQWAGEWAGGALWPAGGWSTVG